MPSFNGYDFIFSIELDVFRRTPAALDKANKLMKPEGLTEGSVAQWQAVDIRVEYVGSFEAFNSPPSRLSWRNKVLRSTSH